MNYEIYKEYNDVISGATPVRPAFNQMLDDASKRKFDMLVFFALDRFSREGARKTIAYLQLLENYGIEYRSFTEPYIDNSGIFKDAIISFIGTLAKMEKIRNTDRVLAGLARARKMNRIGGRPKLDNSVVEKIKKMKTDGHSIMYISKKLKISRSSVYQYL